MTDDARQGTIVPAFNPRARLSPLAAALLVSGSVDPPAGLTAPSRIRAWLTVIVFLSACALASVPWWI